MHPQGASVSCPYVADCTGQPQKHEAISPPRLAFMHNSSNLSLVKLQSAIGGSRGSISRQRVRRRPDRTEATPQRTAYVLAGVVRATLSPPGTRLGSAAVMADDGGIENHTTTAAEDTGSGIASNPTSWAVGRSSSSSRRGAGNGGSQEKQQDQQLRRRSSEENEEQPYPRAKGGVGSSAATFMKEVNAATVAAVVTDPKRDNGSEMTSGRNRADAVVDSSRADDALVTLRQKAFLKRVVQLGLRRRPTEVLALMEDVKREGFPPFNIFMYNACITALARCGRWRQALAVLDHMRHTANAAEAAASDRDNATEPTGKSRTSPGVVRPDVFSYSAAITACGNCGKWRRALALLRVMREQGVAPNVVSYNAAAHACAGDRRNNQGGNDSGEPSGPGEEGWALVLGLMEEMRAEGIAPDVFTFTTAITACGKASQWERALDLLEEMGGAKEAEEGFHRSSIAIAPDVASINAAISACGRAGQWERALDLLDRMGSEPGRWPVDSVRTSRSRERKGQGNLTSSALGSAGSTARASAGAAGLVEADIMQSGGIHGSGRVAKARRIRPAWPAADSVSFNSAMEACAISGRWREGTALFSRMRKAGVRPDVCSYGAYLSCLRAGGQWQRALEVLDKMMVGGQTSGGDITDVKPDLGCYAVVISTLGDAGKWELALKLLRFLQKKGAAGVTAWATEQAKGEGLGAATWDAERLATEASEGNAAISSSPAAGPNLVCYNAALTACARAREAPAALDLLEEMEGRGIFDTASFNSAMLACRGGGQWHKATALLDRMMKGGVARPARDGEGDADGSCARGDAIGSRDTRLRSTLPRPDAYSFASAITACGDVGKADVAVDLLRKMSRAGVEPNVVVFNAVIRAVSRGVNAESASYASQWEGAPAGGERWSGGAGGVDVAAEMEGNNNRAEVVGGARYNSWIRAYDLLEEMRELGLSPETKSYNTVLAVCQRAEAWEGALTVLEEMKRGRVKLTLGFSSKISNRSAAATANGSLWPGKIPPPPDLVSFNTAMGACGKAGKWQEALRLLEELSDFGLCPNEISFNTAAAACARAEEWDRALEIIDRGRESGVITAPARQREDEDVPHTDEGLGRDEESDGYKRFGGAGGRGPGGGGSNQRDMSAFYSTVEAMVHRRQRGDTQGGEISLDVTPNYSNE